MSAAKSALPPPSADLSNAFAKPSSRAANLRLPAKKAPTRPSRPPESSVRAVPAPEATPDPVEPEKAAEAPTKPRAPKVTAAATKKATAGKTPATKAPAAPKKPDATAASRPLVLWTPLSIRSRMQASRSATGASYLDLVLDALEAQVDQLPDLVSEATGQQPVKGRLFERTTPAHPTSTPGERRVQLTIRGALPSQLEVIDQLVESTGAGSRSALCNAALDANLPPA